MLDLPVLTERLSIRRMQRGDLEAFLNFMLDESSTRYLMFSQEQKTDAGARGLFQSVIASYDTAEPIHAYAIADRQTGEYLGSCGYSTYDQDIVECYYSVNWEYRGRGFATEATRALVGH